MVYGRVYAIRSHQTTDIYIGSTKQILCKRMSDHRRDYKRYLNKTFGYITSYELLKHEDAYIELIYEGEFESQNALERKEGEYQREMDCVNKLIAGRTQKERYNDNKESIAEKSNQYYKENKPQILERNKKWHEKNKESIAEKSKKWEENNKEHRAKNRKERYEENKDEINKKAKEKFTCGCGSVCRIGDKSTHEKSKKHLEYIKKLSLEK